jgi:hypothetical protein
VNDKSSQQKRTEGKKVKSMTNNTSVITSIILAACTFSSFAVAQTYYVDATGGSDANDGLSPSAAWKTIDKVNISMFEPGDSVLFKRGETFRGTLSPSSGSPSGYISYGAYGTGNKPRLIGSYQRSYPSDWINEGGNIWRTTHRSVNAVGPELLPNPDFSSDLSAWEKYDNPANGTSSTLSRTTVAGEYYTGPGGGKFVCFNHGEVASDVQLFTEGWSITALRWYRFSFKAKAAQPFTLPRDRITLHKQFSPWTSYSASFSPPLSIAAAWATFEIYYRANTTSDASRITFYFGNIIPNGDTIYIDSCSFRECDTDPEYLNVDVGNLVLNSEMSCGVKVWNRSDLNAQGKFWYDEDNDLLEMNSLSNPGNFYSKIELSLNMHLVDVSGKSYVRCDNLDLRYGTFGVEGSNTDHISVRNCDFSFIGGADQYGGNQTVRLGNGVQFWNGAHDNVVERCTFNQIYDAATTAQGSDIAGFEVYNVYFRNNVINNCEYSFEYWEGGSLSRAHDIYFENNTCLNAGGGWSHSQRPDPNGTHVMVYTNLAQTWNVFIRNNIFCNSVDQGVRWLRKEDVNKVKLDYNCWYESTGPVAMVGNAYYDYATQWEAYKAATKQDSNSINGDPLLNLDLTLQASSPCIDGGITLSTVTDDYNGTLRPQGAAYDIGAFEAPATLLGPPTLLAPTDNIKKVPVNPTLSWKKLPRALKYSLAVSLAPTFSSLVVTDTAVVDTTKIIGPLESGTTYYWRVSARNAGGTSDWSQVWSFTTVVAAPQAPVLAAPADSTKDVQLSTTLSWNAVSDATSYNLQLSSASSFASLVVNDSTITAAYRAIGPLTLATTYYWRVRARNDGGYSTFSQVRVFSTIGTTSIDQLGINIPTEYSLSPNYPNPFNPTTTIRFELPHTSKVSLKVYDVLGQEAVTLVDEVKSAGVYEVKFNAVSLSSGMYVYRIRAGDFVQTRKLLLLR